MKNIVSDKKANGNSKNQILTLRDWAAMTGLSSTDPYLELMRALFNQPELKKIILELESLNPKE